MFSKPIRTKLLLISYSFSWKGSYFREKIRPWLIATSDIHIRMIQHFHPTVHIHRITVDSPLKLGPIRYSNIFVYFPTMTGNSSFSFLCPLYTHTHTHINTYMHTHADALAHRSNCKLSFQVQRFSVSSFFIFFQWLWAFGFGFIFFFFLVSDGSCFCFIILLVACLKDQIYFLDADFFWILHLVLKLPSKERGKKLVGVC